MTDIAVYVKSSALGNTGIHWRNASDRNHQPEETPELLQKPVVPRKIGGKAAVNYLFTNQKEPSLLLMRYDEKLLLQVAGFDSPERSEKMGSRVFNSLAWVVKDDDKGELFIRKIAAQILEDIWISKNLKLREIVDQAVTFDGIEAFKVDIDKIHQFIQGEAGNIDSAPEDIEYKIYPIKCTEYQSQSLKKLKKEIQNHNLPKSWKSWSEQKEEGVIVIVTNWLPDSGILHKAGVWRGIADDVKEPEKKITQIHL